MQVQRSGEHRAGIQIQQSNAPKAFMAGKTTLYSDFDGTFIPAEYSLTVYVIINRRLINLISSLIFTKFGHYSAKCAVKEKKASLIL